MKNNNNITSEMLNNAVDADLYSFIRKSFLSLNPGTQYLNNWHIEMIAESLNLVSEGKIKRLLINMPPRSLKSTSITVAWPAWLLGRNPAARIMTASYSSMLSIKHSLETRRIMSTPWYHELFPQTLFEKGQNEKNRFVTTQNGFRFATSVNGSATGEGADLLIIDDPHSPQQAYSALKRNNAINWFDRTFSTRLNDKKKGAIVLVMQRLHECDLSGHLVEQGGWHHLCFPSVFKKNYFYFCNELSKKITEGDFLHATREAKAEIEEAQKYLGSNGFSAQYQQMPLMTQNSMLQAPWIQRFFDLQNQISVKKGMRVQSWDTAIKSGPKNDYSACTTWEIRNDGYYLLNVFLSKLDYPALKNECTTLASKWSPDSILIEDKATGQALLQDLRASTLLPVIPINPMGEKIIRFARVTPLFEAGRIYMPDNAEWLAEYEAQLFSFPGSLHDDMVDSTSQFLNWVLKGGQRMVRICKL